MPEMPSTMNLLPISDAMRRGNRVGERGPYFEPSNPGNHLYFFYLPEGKDGALVAKVEVLSPGGGQNGPHFPIDEIRRAQFSAAIAQWEADVASGCYTVKGTQLENWGAMSAETVHHFYGMKIFTTAALANINDSNLVAFGTGAREWRRKAMEFENQQAVEAPVKAVEAHTKAVAAQVEEIKRADAARDAATAAQLAAMQATLDGMAAALARMNGNGHAKTAKPRRSARSRRPKAAAPEPAVVAELAAE